MSTQVATLKQVTHTLDQLVDRTREYLPSDVNSQLLQSNAMMYINKDQKLKEYAIQNPMEVAQHLYNFVTLGLDVYQRDAYLLFYGKTLTPIIDYKGLISLAIKYSVEDILKIDTEIVREKDFVNMKNGVFTHEFNPFLERGDKIGVYCAIHYKNGAIKYEHMTKEEVLKIKNSSPSGKSEYSPWNKWEESMWIKSVIRKAMKTVPLDFGKQDRKYAEFARQSFDESDKEFDFTVVDRSNNEEVIDQSQVVEAEVIEKVEI